MVPGITHLFVKKLHRTVFEEFIRNERTDKYNLMCSIEFYSKHCSQQSMKLMVATSLTNTYVVGFDGKALQLTLMPSSKYDG